ncbi:hypothetical protein [Oribacterium sp. FC2011]|uniref:hypothetical protein n=1 Tax=Oribacterium sp. FC2011 TaxID=1408311 RepID=UPI0004E2224D|nr:hypothetical protein [Oribacterium sp. FC2011]
MKLIDHKNDKSIKPSNVRRNKHWISVFSILIISLLFLNACDTGVPEAATEAWETEETSAITGDSVEDYNENSDPANTESKEDDGLFSFLDTQKEKEKTWKTYDSLADAEKASGLVVSDKLKRGLKQFNHIEYRALEDTMIELVYTDKNGNEGYRFRQGHGTDDISEDDKNYDEENDYKMGKVIVHTKGSNGHITIATYTDGKNSYAFMGKAYQPPLIELIGIYVLTA